MVAVFLLVVVVVDEDDDEEDDDDSIEKDFEVIDVRTSEDGATNAENTVRGVLRNMPSRMITITSNRTILIMEIFFSVCFVIVSLSYRYLVYICILCPPIIYTLLNIMAMID